MAGWDQISTLLSSIDFQEFQPSTPERFYVPKSRFAYRIAHSLDVFDFLVLTAKSFEIAQSVEAQRVPLNREIVHSYRILPGPDTLFATDGYASFQAKSIELASKPDCKYVLCVDIVDFFNQISTHRVENALEEAGVGEDVARAFEEILLSLNLRSSRGIPVGQEFSRLLAESATTSIDDWLISRGITYVRYVDDFRFFCKSFSDTVQILLGFSEKLDQPQLKLCTNDEKTRT